MTSNLAIKFLFRRDPRQEQAAWIKILLSEQFPEVKEFFLYGSVSMIHPFSTSKEKFSFDEDSDYDFAAQYTEKLKLDLVNKGWELKDALSYRDEQTWHVFEGEVAGERVQVSLRDSLASFKYAWNSISPEFYWTYLNKRSENFIGRDGVKLYLNQIFLLSSVHFSSQAGSSAKVNEVYEYAAF